MDTENVVFEFMEKKKFSSEKELLEFQGMGRHAQIIVIFRPQVLQYLFVVSVAEPVIIIYAYIPVLFKPVGFLRCPRRGAALHVKSLF